MATEEAFDLSRIAVGTFAMLGGTSADYAKSQVLNRAQVPLGHSLRKGLTNAHASDHTGPVLPDVFPPDGYAAKLESAQDYLDLIDTAAAPPADPAPGDPQGGG